MTPRRLHLHGEAGFRGVAGLPAIRARPGEMRAESWLTSVVRIFHSLLRNEDAMDKPADSTSQPLEASLPAGAPVFLCPSCECPLEYEGSHPIVRANSPADLSDRYRCPAGCGIFEHDRHGHRFRILGAGYTPHPQ
jgi:predicted RNA-binding Zn-ribbon protein involved in translation (DUF1610 family)